MKYLWLPSELEEPDYKEDPVRIDLLSSQILSDITNKKFTLLIKEYYLYSSLYVFVNHS